MGGLLFLTPSSLAAMEADIQDRMWTLQPSSAPAIAAFTAARCLHHKSYIRLMNRESLRGVDDDDRDRDRRRRASWTASTATSSASGTIARGQWHRDCICTDIAWFHLTSACLSKGAKIIIGTQLLIATARYNVPSHNYCH